MSSCRYATLGTLLALVGCSQPTEFACTSDQACALEGQAGKCQLTGYCSLPDPTCAAGQRYVEHAPDELRDLCVDLVATAANHHRIELTWDGRGATSFDVEQNGALLRSGVSGTRFTSRGLDPTTEYVFRVRPAGTGEDFRSPPARAVTAPEPGGSYADQVLADEPRGYWQLEEISGPLVTDTTGTVTAGTVFGPAEQNVDGRVGSGIGFDGDEMDPQYAGLGAVHTLESEWGWTWELWVDLVAVHQDSSLLLGCNNAPRWTVEMDGAIQMGMLLRSEGAFLGLVAQTKLPFDGDWHHLAVTVEGAVTDQSVSRMYLDGVLIGEEVADGSIDSPWSRAEAGTGGEGDLLLNLRDSLATVQGTYDEAVAYDYVVGAAQIRRHHERGAAE